MLDEFYGTVFTRNRNDAPDNTLRASVDIFIPRFYAADEDQAKEYIEILAWATGLMPRDSVVTGICVHKKEAAE